MKVLADYMFEDFEHIARDTYLPRHRIRYINEKLEKHYRMSRLKSDRIIPLTIPMPITLICKCAVGKHVEEEDILLGNWFKLFMGLLANTNSTKAVNKDGSTEGLRTSSDVTYSPSIISVGNGTTPESYDDYNLVSHTADLDTSRSVSHLADRSRVSFQATADRDAEEFGLRQGLFDPGGTTHIFYLSRKVSSVANGQVITINVDFVSPWTYNIALIMFGIHNNTDVDGVKDHAGNVFTARTTGDMNSYGVEVDVDTSPITWSPTEYTLPSPLPTSTERFFLESKLTDILIMNAYRIPVSDEEINSVGLRLGVYDTGATEHDVYVALISLAEPVTFKANVRNLLHVRIVAF